jgi:signal recognition particle GTPase
VRTRVCCFDQGGVIVALAHALQLPVHFVCYGERIDQIQTFDPSSFTDELFRRC